jgi:acetyltransferase
MTATGHESSAGRPRPGDVDVFFAPRSVAVLGVSAGAANLGRNIVANLAEFGFDGDIIPVGARGGDVAGRRILAAVEDAGRPIDLAVILVPAVQVPTAVEACGRAGVRGVVISSGGFGEYGAERAALEREILAAARRAGVRILGPNCIGVVNLATGLCLPFPPLSRAEFTAGPHSFVCQSGGVMLYLAERFSEEGLGVRILVSEGNKLDLDEADLLGYLMDDPGTRVIFLYMEGMTRGREVLRAAARSPKPVVVLKSNIGEASARIARSHTAAVATDERVVDAALQQAGVVRVHDLDDFLLCAKAFALPPLRGDNVVVACMSGGMSVVAADACVRHGLRLPALPADLVGDLERHSRGGVIRLGNPMDLGDIHDTGVFISALERLLALDSVDGVAFCLPSPEGPARMLGGGPSMDDVVRRALALAAAHDKPVALSFFAGRRAVAPLVDRVQAPVFWTITESIDALARSREAWRRRSRPVSPAFTFASDPAPSLSRPGARGQRGSERGDRLSDALDILGAAGLPVEETHLAGSPEAAAVAAERLGYPVAVKIVSPDLSHKTDVGGVALDLASATAAETACREMLGRVHHAAPGARIDGFAVQRMRGGGHEVLVGARRDAVFGPVVVFGLGGIWVEALGDVALRLAPISREDALEMIGELRGAPLLRGLRGGPAADIDALVEVLLGVSALITEHADIRELDLNPVMVGAQGAVVVDARIVWGDEPR